MQPRIPLKAPLRSSQSCVTFPWQSCNRNLANLEMYKESSNKIQPQEPEKSEKVEQSPINDEIIAKDLALTTPYGGIVAQLANRR